MSFLIEQARMSLMIGSTVLCRFTDIAFHDYHPVDRYLDVIPISYNFFIIPFTRRFKRTMMFRLSRDNSINGTVMLQRSNILINRMFTIQNLDFHTNISGIPFHRGTDTDTVISTRRQLEFETVHEVAILVFRIQVSTIALARYHGNATVFQGIINRVTCPFMHIRTVKQNLKTFLLFFG